jgi:hypothetical protein
LSLEEQFAAGFALQAFSHANEADLAPGQRALVASDALRTTAFRDPMTDVRSMPAASRGWYRDVPGAPTT